MICARLTPFLSPSAKIVLRVQLKYEHVVSVMDYLFPSAEMEVLVEALDCGTVVGSGPIYDANVRPMVIAIKDGDLNKVARLLNRGVSVNQCFVNSRGTFSFLLVASLAHCSPHSLATLTSLSRIYICSFRYQLYVSTCTRRRT